MNRIKKYTLFYFITVTALAFSLRSHSLGGAYQPSIVSNIFLPDLGINSYISVNPISTIGYVSLMKIFYLVVGTDIVMSTNIAGIYSIFAIIFSYQLFLSVLPGDTNVKKFIGYIYPLLLIGLDTSILRGYVFSFTIPLCFVILFFLLNKNTQRNYTSMFLIALISWISLGLFWHTLFTLTFILICFYLIFPYIFNPMENKTKIKWNLFILVVVTFIFIWYSLRESTLYNLVANQHIEINFLSLFNKGSLASEYGYQSIVPVYYIDFIRYLGYLLIYIIMGVFSLNALLKTTLSKEFVGDSVLIVVFLLSDLLFQIIYFCATKSISPRVLILLSYPLMLIIILSKSKPEQDILSNIKLKYIIATFLIFSLFITSMSGLYEYAVEKPEKRLDANIYNDNFYWVMTHSNTKYLFSDTHTIGHYQILYSNSEFYSRDKLFYKCLDYRKYKSIVDSEFKLDKDDVLLINTELYKKHLIFGSLEAWSEYEPLNKTHISQNKNLNLLYDDGRIVMAK